MYTLMSVLCFQSRLSSTSIQIELFNPNLFQILTSDPFNCWPLLLRKSVPCVITDLITNDAGKVGLLWSTPPKAHFSPYVMKESLVLHCFVSNHIKKRALLPSLLAVSTICAYSKKIQFFWFAHPMWMYIKLLLFVKLNRNQALKKQFFVESCLRCISTQLLEWEPG